MTTPPPPIAAHVRCAEDMPCWNWRTMGNHKRGVITVGGRRLVVGPIRFDRMDCAGYVDHHATPPLLGDEHACIGTALVVHS